MKLLPFSLSLLFLSAALTACSPSSSSSNAEAEEHEEEEVDANDIQLTDEQVRAVGITFGHVTERNLSDVLRVNGVTALNPQDRADVSPLVGGSLRSIAVIEGSKVAKGQVVAWIENTEIVALQREYLQSQTALAQAQRELQRQRQLHESGAGVEKNLQQAESAYDIARADVTGLSYQLRQLGISEKSVKQGNLTTRIAVRTPISGYVDKIYKSTGSYANAEQPVLTVVDDSKMHVDINLYEKDMAGLAKGQKVDFVLTNNPSVHLSGEIYEFASSFTDNTKTILAHVRITDRGTATKLIPGMYVTGTVQRTAVPSKATRGGGPQAADKPVASPAVPSKAIASSEGKNFIFVLEKTEEKTADKDGKKSGQKVYHFRRVEVVTGAEELGYTAITPVTALPASATIVTAGAFYLSSMLGEEADHGH